MINSIPIPQTTVEQDSKTFNKDVFAEEFRLFREGFEPKLNIYNDELDLLIRDEAGCYVFLNIGEIHGIENKSSHRLTAKGIGMQVTNDFSFLYNIETKIAKNNYQKIFGIRNKYKSTLELIKSNAKILLQNENGINKQKVLQGYKELYSVLKTMLFQIENVIKTKT
jgi:hypothetical protein